MRKLLLVLLACSAAGSGVLRAQSGPSFQEPLPVQSVAPRFFSVPGSQFAPAWIPFGLPADWSTFSQPANEPPSFNPQGPPPEPNEPYLVWLGTWKPRKGYTFYGSADYLFWWMKGQSLPSGLSLSVSDPSSAPELTTRGMSGGRFFLGMWIDERQSKAIEAGYFFLGRRNSTSAIAFPASAAANPPFFNGIASESSSLETSTGIWGAEANGRWQIWRTVGANDGSVTRPTAFLDFLLGFRYVDLSEAVTINGTTRFANSAALLSDATMTTSDTFGTHNHIFAGQIGADAGVRWGRLGLNIYSKVGFGANEQSVNINGITQVNSPTALGAFTTPGGFYAQNGNIGHYSRDGFTVIPEAGVNVGYVLADRCRLTLGYSFLYLSNVVRPGGQVDATAGGATRPPISFLTGAQAQPTHSGFDLTGFWAQGFNVGLELSY